MAEAARDTHLRVEQLEALEAEEFDRLPGDVYVRGSLRTYSRYLGLDPEKVVRIYGRHADEIQPAPPPPKTGRVERAIAATRIRDNQTFLLIAASVVLLVLLAVGILNGRDSTPVPADMDGTVGVVPAGSGRSIEIELVALRDATLMAVIDGQEQLINLEAGDVRGLMAERELTLGGTDGSAVRLAVNGRKLHHPAAPGDSWQKTWSFDTESTGS